MWLIRSAANSRKQSVSNVTVTLALVGVLLPSSFPKSQVMSYDKNSVKLWNFKELLCVGQVKSPKKKTQLHTLDGYLIKKIQQRGSKRTVLKETHITHKCLVFANRQMRNFFKTPQLIFTNLSSGFIKQQVVQSASLLFVPLQKCILPSISFLAFTL